MTRPQPNCVFCKIIHDQAPAKIVERTMMSIIFEPLKPHAPGHVLVVPKRHIVDATDDTSHFGYTMMSAANYAAGLDQDCNILTSVGKDATQTVFHLHIHVIPRGPDDDLYHDWPWMRERGSGKA